MNQFLRVAAVGAFVAFAAGSANAGEDCLSLMAKYDSATAMSAGTTDAQLSSATDMFRSVMKSAEKAKLCYSVKLAAAEGEDEISTLRAGAAEATRQFREAQQMFEKSLDDISAATLSDVAPAAGPDSVMGMGDEIAVSSMEQLFDSYMVLERAQELDAELQNLK